MKILLVGAGRMGSALITNWQKKFPSSLYSVDPNAQTFEGVSCVASPDQLTDLAPDAIVFAVKPQRMEDVLPLYAAQFPKCPLVISIAAGKPLSLLSSYFPHATCVRAMPNLPAAIGKGITALSAHPLPSATQERLSSLFQTLGEVVWVDEEKMDVVTALSGSGPAYSFYFIEALASAGVHMGLPPELATAFALHTVHGAAHMALKSPDSLTQLREDVTSPGGTTEAAFKILSPDLETLLTHAVLAATQRASELADSA